jgi:type I restriction enzyme S subunit
MPWKYQAYPEYKESRIEWLGLVPTIWSVSRLAYVFTKANAGEVIDKTYWGEGKELLYTCNRTPLKSDYSEFPEEKRTDPNDLLLTRNGTPYVHKPIPGSIYSNVVQRITLKKGFDRDYLMYCLGNSARNLKGYGVSIESLNFESWKSLSFAYPSKNEQIRVVVFLDYETAKIDTLIEKQQQLIALLKEKRQAVISHAVTRGIDESANFIESGIPRVGSYPTHWEIVMLGKKIQLQRGVDITKDEQTHGNVPVVSSGGISSYHNKFTCKGPGVVVGRKGTAGKLHYVESDFWAHDTTLYVKEFNGNDVRYAYYKLVSMKLEDYDTGSANPTLNRNNVHPEKVSWPPIIEQREIVEYLDTFCDLEEKAIKQVNQAIMLLQERRTALISAAVTGKIDVRNWQAPETNHTSRKGISV